MSDKPELVHVAVARKYIGLSEIKGETETIVKQNTVFLNMCMSEDASQDWQLKEP